MARRRQIWRTLVFITCGLFISFDVWYQYAAHEYLTDFTKKLFPRTIRDSVSKVTAEEETLFTDSAVNLGITNNVNTTLEMSSTKRISTLQNQTDIPGLLSMDRALKLPPRTHEQIRNEDSNKFLYSQKRDYNFIISHSDVCKSLPVGFHSKKYDYTTGTKIAKSNELFLVMAIKSMCKSKDRRKAIRKTWGNETFSREVLNSKVKIVFLLGACENSKLQKELLEEDRKHSDILQWDFVDTFRNLTLKDCLFLQWFAKNCRQAPYIFKGDDDIFVNIENILKFLVDLPQEKVDTVFVGSKLEGSQRIVNPKSKYFVGSNLFSGKYYPPYLSGGGFLLSGKLAVKFFLQTLKTRIIPIDDAFLGILAESLGIKPENNKGFKSWGMRKTDHCRISKIKTFHRASPKHMTKLWNDLKKAKLAKCGNESNDVLHHQF